VVGEIFRTLPDEPPGPTSLLYNGYRFSHRISSRDLTLTTQLYLATRKAIPKLCAAAPRDILEHCFSFKQTSGFFNLPTINILWSVLGGDRLSTNDGEFMTLLQKISRLFRAGNPSGDVLDVFPFLRFIMPGLAGYQERKSGTEYAHKFLRVSK
jgi:hypothetical protein